MKKLTILLIVLVIFLLGITSFVTAQDLSMFSGSPGGGWYPLAVAISEIWMKNIPDLSFRHADAGGAGNIAAIDGGKADVALSTGSSIGDAVMGNPPFTKPATNVKALATFAPEFYALLVWADSDIHTILDLKGKRLSPAPKGYTVEVMTRVILEAAGLSYDDLAKVDYMDISESASLMQDGHLDAMVTSIILKGEPSITELETTRPIRVLEIPDDIMKHFNPGILPAILPAGSYKGVTKDTQIPSYSLGLAVSANLSEDLVYKMTKYLAENWSDMQLVSADLVSVQPKDLAKPLGVEFHPGAAKYYQEQGWLK